MSVAFSEAQRPMHIVWVVDGVEGSEQQGYRSNLASNRYRAILPAQALREKGHRVTFVSAKDWHWQPENAPEAVVIGKLLAGRDAARYREVSEQVLKQVGAAVRAGTPVIADFNDDHFDHPLMGGYWRQLARLATVCVAGSDPMAQLLAGHTQRPTQVVGDPIASPPGEPRVFRAATGLQRLVSRLLPGGAQQRLKLAWYGNTVNWPAMQRWAQELAPLSQTQPFVLWLITSPTDAVQSFVQDFNARHAPSALAELIEWDEQTQWDVVRDADIVLLPSDPSDPKKNVKTSNRLVDALNMGRAVVASPLPSYKAFESSAVLTDVPLDGVRWWLEHSNEALMNVVQGQGAAKAMAGLTTISERWISAVVVAKTEISQQANVEPLVNEKAELNRPIVRLNLGCGDKILPDFINVDLENNWSGRPPDIVADVTVKLPFEDGYADEVHAYHVLEHLRRWEVESCLSEWIRVLKPGGLLILEMPCLDKILGIYRAYAERGENPPLRLTKWALYGDPGYKVDAMMHQWCYGIEELTGILRSVGLVNICVESPRTHIGIRDMRQVGQKPYENLDAL